MLQSRGGEPPLVFVLWYYFLLPGRVDGIKKKITGRHRSLSCIAIKLFMAVGN